MMLSQGVCKALKKIYDLNLELSPGDRWPWSVATKVIKVVKKRLRTTALYCLSSTKYGFSSLALLRNFFPLFRE